MAKRCLWGNRAVFRGINTGIGPHQKLAWLMHDADNDLVGLAMRSMAPKHLGHQGAWLVVGAIALLVICAIVSVALGP